jgi:phage terminase large subunit-like protein
MYKFSPKPEAKYRYNYGMIAQDLNCFHKENKVDEALALIRSMVLDDLFFLLYFVLNIPEVNEAWLVDRMNDINRESNRTLDMWARFHWKSTIRTVGKTIQDVLRNSEKRVVIFSHTRDIAKSFLRRIKGVFEGNAILKAAFPDVLYDEPHKERIKWSEDEGLTVKRMSTYTEATVEAYGLVDSMPVGKHYTDRIYDDLVTRLSVSTKKQRDKVEEMFQLSQALGTPDGNMAVIGTRYHFGDMYNQLIKSGEWTVRELPATHNGDYPPPLGNGRGILYPTEQISQFLKDMGKDVFAAQMLLNPTKADSKAFDLEWVRYYKTKPYTQNFVFVDPASSKKEYADYTSMWVVGIDKRGYCFVLDGVRDRMNMGETMDVLFRLVDKWGVMKVFYEKYGMQRDIEAIKEKQKEHGMPFKIQELGGFIKKEDRIKSLQSNFLEGRLLFPETLPYKTITGKKVDLVREFLFDEYVDYPSSPHDDMLDCLARINDEKVKLNRPVYVEPEPYRLKNRDPFGLWEDVNSKERYAWMGK